MITEVQLRGLGGFAYRGFTLEDPDNHSLFLLHDGRCIATFQPAARPEVIQEECIKHLVVSRRTVEQQADERQADKPMSSIAKCQSSYIPLPIPQI